jgi:HKD family nuclease
MEIKFLGQGIEPLSEKAVGNVLMKCFSDTDFNSFTAISAFATISGVKGISKFISESTHLKNNLIVVGVNEKVTSKEALEEIIKIENTNSYVFYANNNSIFHPKIYLFEGNLKSILIIGSSNLTGRGLFTNIEASLQVSIDNNIDKDRKIIEQLKQYFKGIFEQTDENLKSISTELIDNLVKSGIVPTDSEQKENREKSKKVTSKETNDLISKIFPKRTMAKIPKEFISKSIKKEQPKVLKPFFKSSSQLLWQSGKLTERDLNIPKSKKTNPTGSMFFKKGLTKGIDQRHYFREVVFKDLDWIKDLNPKTSYYERTHTNFRIIIKNVDFGIHELLLNHNTKTDSKTYIQKNSMTSISWGDAKSIVAKEELIGCNASLYYNVEDLNVFTLLIE